MSVVLPPPTLPSFYKLQSLKVHTKNTRNELARLVMGTISIFLVTLHTSKDSYIGPVMCDLRRSGNDACNVIGLYLKTRKLDLKYQP